MGASATVAVLVGNAVGPATSLIATTIACEPSSKYVWLPVTENAPGPVEATTPASGDVPSPQSMVALKSLTSAAVFASVNVATTPWKVGGAVGKLVAPSVVVTSTPVAVRAASLTVAASTAVEELPPGSCTVTVMLKFPAAL